MDRARIKVESIDRLVFSLSVEWNQDESRDREVVYKRQEEGKKERMKLKRRSESKLLGYRQYPGLEMRLVLRRAGRFDPNEGYGLGRFLVCGKCVRWLHVMTGGVASCVLGKKHQVSDT